MEKADLTFVYGPGLHSAPPEKRRLIRSQVATEAFHKIRSQRQDERMNALGRFLVKRQAPKALEGSDDKVPRYCSCASSSEVIAHPKSKGRLLLPRSAGTGDTADTTCPVCGRYRPSNQTTISKPSPASMLGAGRVNPFASYGSSAESTRCHELLDYCMWDLFLYVIYLYAGLIRFCTISAPNALFTQFAAK